LLRGFAHFPKVPGYLEKFGLKAAAIAINGLYRGVAVCCGMHLVPIPGSRIEDEFSALEASWAGYDFFYLHVKQTDTAGEKGDFQGKVRAIEEVDAQLPRLLALDPDVIIISGDHSSPAVLKSHSWHPVPTLLYAKNVFADGIAEFGERACRRGSLGLLPATQIMTLAMANAQRLSKYGA
jgi:2,3-bisphosphoglycerate-independent phosphoglycerate mutase